MQLVGGVLEVGDEGLFDHGALKALRADAGQAVDLGVAQHLGVGDGEINAGAKFLDAVRVAGDAALALGPVTGGQVEQHLGQAVGIELRLDFGAGEVVREQVFDPGEACIGGSLEAGEEVLFGEQHGQVGG
ncbi:hypothetical protein D3C85_1101510 [compost metagenome]